MTNLELAETAVPSATTRQHHHEDEAKQPVARSQAPSAAKASPSSPDPLRETDRYRLVTPYLLQL